jgi:hypothetical protein
MRVADTSLASPADIAEPGREAELSSPRRYLAAPRSTVLLIGRPAAPSRP